MDDIISLTSEESEEAESDLGGTTASDIFYIYRSSNDTKAYHTYHGSFPDAFWFTQQTQPIESKNRIRKKLRSRCNTNITFSSYIKHTNLDTRTLTLPEKVHLFRIHYLTFGNAFRLLLILLCFLWFLFNAYIVFNDYLKFETVVYMEYRSPKSTLPPAISICTENILGKIPPKSMKNFRVYDVFEEKKFKNYFQRDSDNIQCLLNYATVGDSANQIINCSELVPVLFSIEEGRKCWTYFSDVYGQMSKKNKSTNGTFQFDFESFPSIRLIIFGGRLEESDNNIWKSDKYSDDKGFDISKEMSSTGLLLALHDPTQIHYMHDLPMHTIPPGKYLDSRFNKKIEDFNPNSGCFNYHGLGDKSPNYNNLLHQEKNTEQIFKENHLSDYRSRGECFIYCISRLLNHEKCVNVYSILTRELIEREYLFLNLNEKYPHTRAMDFGRPRQTFCSNWNESLSQYLSVKYMCLNLCPSACSTESYDVDTNFVTDNFDDSITVIEIQWSPEPITYISHREKFDNSEFIGNIGGHAHIWLGVSVIHIVRYVIAIIRNWHFVGIRNRSNQLKRMLSNICRTEH